MTLAQLTLSKFFGANTRQKQPAQSARECFLEAENRRLEAELALAKAHPTVTTRESELIERETYVKACEDELLRRSDGFIVREAELEQWQEELEKRERAVILKGERLSTSVA